MRAGTNWKDAQWNPPLGRKATSYCSASQSQTIFKKIPEFYKSQCSPAQCTNPPPSSANTPNKLHSIRKNRPPKLKRPCTPTPANPLPAHWAQPPRRRPPARQQALPTHGVRTRRQHSILRAFQADRTLHLPPLLLQFLQQVLDVRLGGPIHLGRPRLGGLVRAVGLNGGGRPGRVSGFRGALEEALGELVEVRVVGRVAAAEDEERVVATLQRKKLLNLEKGVLVCNSRVSKIAEVNVQQPISSSRDDSFDPLDDEHIVSRGRVLRLEILLVFNGVFLEVDKHLSRLDGADAAVERQEKSKM